MKFKIGDKIGPIVAGGGFEDATVQNIFTEEKGKNKGKQYYKLGISCGIATIPVSAEVNYKLLKK